MCGDALLILHNSEETVCAAENKCMLGARAPSTQSRHYGAIYLMEQFIVVSRRRQHLGSHRIPVILDTFPQLGGTIVYRIGRFRKKRGPSTRQTKEGLPWSYR